MGPTGQLLVTGQVVNAAARLQTAAQPGEVLVGATTHALTKDAVSFGPQQEVEAKGFAGALPGLPGGAAHHPIGPAHDPVRGPVERDGHPARERREGEGDRQPAPRLDPRRARASASRGSPTSCSPGSTPTVTVLRGRAQTYGDTATFAPVTAIVREIAGIEDDMAPEEAMRPAAGRRRRVLRSERGGAGRRAAGSHDRARRSEARGVGLRAGRAERVPRRWSRASARAERSCSCSKTCTCSVRRCSI